MKKAHSKSPKDVQKNPSTTAKKVAIVGRREGELHKTLKKSTEKPKPPLHFKLEIIEDKGSLVMYGIVKELVNGICHIMEQKPDFAAILLNAATTFLDRKNSNI